MLTCRRMHDQGMWVRAVGAGVPKCTCPLSQQHAKPPAAEPAPFLTFYYCLLSFAPQVKLMNVQPGFGRDTVSSSFPGPYIMLLRQPPACSARVCYLADLAAANRRYDGRGLAVLAGLAQPVGLVACIPGASKESTQGSKHGCRRTAPG